MKQLGGQLVIAAVEDLKEEGLMVIVSYFVGGIKLADSGAKEIKFVKKEKMGNSLYENKTKVDSLNGSENKQTFYMPDQTFKMNVSSPIDEAIYSETKHQKRHRKKHKSKK